MVVYRDIMLLFPFPLFSLSSSTLDVESYIPDTLAGLQIILGEARIKPFGINFYRS